jgi:hypothetical protein
VDRRGPEWPFIPHVFPTTVRVWGTGPQPCLPCDVHRSDVSPVTTGAVLRHLETDKVIVRSRDDLWGDVFATDSAVPWIMPASIWSAPGAVRRFEASYGPITDRRIGWLRRRLTIAARLLTG